MRKRNLWLAAIALLLALALLSGFQVASKKPTSADPLIAGFERSTVASVADAVDQVVGSRGFMSHDMRPRIPGIVVGRAKTALLRQTTPDKATPQLSAKHSVEMIDEAKPGEVGVIVIENGLDVAGIGGLMGTAAKARGMAGIIIDGGVRDLPELRSLGVPVYSRSITPSSSVGRWATVAKNIEVNCAGIRVRPGDIIVAGEDGVVVVPKEKEQEVLARAKEIDQRESKMVPYIQKFQSLTKAIAEFNRI